MIKETNFGAIVSALAAVCATVTLFVVFAIPVLAQCSAEVTCPGGGKITCSCPGQGSCAQGLNWVQCNCQNLPPMEPACCGGTCQSD